MSRRVSLQIPPAQGRLDLGVGHPGPALLPLTELHRTASDALAGDDPSVLQYGAEQGDEHFRRALAAFLTEQSSGTGAPPSAAHSAGSIPAPGTAPSAGPSAGPSGGATAPRHGSGGRAVDPARLFVTSGASQALDLVCTLATRAGERVLVEAPSYHLALAMFADHGLEVGVVASDEDGVVPEALERELAARPAALLYVVSAFANPSGRTLAPERHARVRDVAARHAVTVVSDEAYRLLAFDGAPPPTLAFEGAEHVLALGSFSKILAPGLRLGWVQAEPVWMQRLERAGLLLSGGGLNPLPSALVGPLLEDGTLGRHLGTLRRTYAERAEVLAAALARHVPAARFGRPLGGYYLWPRVPGVDFAALLPRALEHGVGFVPGARFAPTSLLASAVSSALAERARLCFAYHAAPELEEAIRRLATALGDAALQSASPNPPAPDGHAGPERRAPEPTSSPAVPQAPAPPRRSDPPGEPTGDPAGDSTGEPSKEAS